MWVMSKTYCESTLWFLGGIYQVTLWWREERDRLLHFQQVSDSSLCWDDGWHSLVRSHASWYRQERLQWKEMSVFFHKNVINDNKTRIWAYQSGFPVSTYDNHVWKTNKGTSACHRLFFWWWVCVCRYSIWARWYLPSKVAQGQICYSHMTNRYSTTVYQHHVRQLKTQWVCEKGALGGWRKSEWSYSTNNFCEDSLIFQCNFRPQYVERIRMWHCWKWNLGSRRRKINSTQWCISNSRVRSSQ